jgi:tetratricopeptide (TPR) repeat protein
MPRPNKPDPLLQSFEDVAAVLEGFDYSLHPEDFVLYELHRLIEEDQATFDDPAFRKLVDDGIRAHIEDNLEVRARLAGILRSASLQGESRVIAMRVVHALEDLESDLSNVAVLVRNYTKHLLSRLETIDAFPINEKVTAAADLLFESTGDRGAAEAALDILCNTQTPVSARVLAHAISEPLLDEDLELRAFKALKAGWPLPRAYMFYNLREHPHEDIPIRWFQLFVEMDESTTVELALEELRAHAENPDYHEDLAALMEVLHGCHDPELEDKILAVLNSSSTSPAALPFLQKFLEAHSPPARTTPNPWSRHEHALEANRRYLDAARLLDRGKLREALDVLEQILASDPDYPFARMLKEVVSKRSA